MICWIAASYSYCLKGKRDVQYPDLETERMKSQHIYEELLNRVWHRIGTDLSGLAPREWPRLSCLSEAEQQRLLDLHPTAAPLKAVSEYDAKLVQRLLLYPVRSLAI